MNIEFTFTLTRLFDFLLLIGLPTVIVLYTSSLKKDYLHNADIFFHSIKTDDSKLLGIVYGKPTSYNLITEEVPNAYFSVILGVFASSVYFKQIIGLLFIIFLLCNCSIYKKSINIAPNQNTDIETFEKLTEPKLKKCKIQIFVLGAFMLIALILCFFTTITFKKGE